MNEHNEHDWKNILEADYDDYSEVVFWCTICGSYQRERYVDNRSIYSGPIQMPLNLIN